MIRCIYCHLVKDLDSKGRCSSCADAGDATAYGLHYGDYMAAKPRPYVLPVAVTPLRELPIMNPEKVCRICGEPLPSNMRKYCTPECAHLGILKTQRESKARKKKGNGK